MPAPNPRAGSLAPHETLDLSELLGSDWDGFSLGADGLQHPSWRRAFSAGEFRAMFWRCQQVRILEHELAQVRAELDRARADLETSQARAAWYRRQLRLESRAGLMLSALST